MSAEHTNNGAGIVHAAAPDRDSTDKAQQRALVSVNQETTERPGRVRLSDAVFLAHMIATKVRAPQTCEKRRADPDDANASYRQATQPIARTGRIISRKI